MKRFPKFSHLARLCVIGVGGGGGNAVNRMIQDGVHGVDFISVNTDTLALFLSEAPTRIQIGDAGSGAGGDPAIGRKAAIESRDQLRRVLEGADLVFVTAGMGGGTGSGASPIIAQVAREVGAVTIGVVTYPFRFEGGMRQKIARRSVEALREHVDTLIAIPNDGLLSAIDAQTALHDAFRLADNSLRQAVQSVTEIITQAGMINVDFADVRSVVAEGGNAMMAVGNGTGPEAARTAAQAALASTLPGMTVSGARGILFNVRANPTVSISDLEAAADIVRMRAHPDANFIWGFVQDGSMKDEVCITVIATGFEQGAPYQQEEEKMAKILEEVGPPIAERDLPVRRVHLADNVRRKRRAHVSGNARFSRQQWGMPAYLR